MKQILLKLSRACAENAAYRYIATFINIIKLFALRAAQSLPHPCRCHPFFPSCGVCIEIVGRAPSSPSSIFVISRKCISEFSSNMRTIFFCHSFYPQPVSRSDFSLTLSYKYFHFICVMVNYSLLVSLAYMYVWITLEHAQIFFHYSFYPARAFPLMILIFFYVIRVHLIL